MIKWIVLIAVIFAIYNGVEGRGILWHVGKGLVDAVRVVFLLLLVLVLIGATYALFR